MRKTLFSLLFLLSGMMANAAGESCSNPIPMGKDYHANVQNGQSIWYTASTFDLPLTVTFAPKNGSSDPAPEVEMDFSCTTGFYEDSILCSLFCKSSGSSGIAFDLPHKPELKSKTIEGKFVYYLSLGQQYRDLLLEMGISYAVDVFVKVTYKSAGTISLAPDDLFSNCVDGAKFMQYGDTVHVAAKDKDRHVTVPYVQWQEDTVLYIWDKEATSNCRVVVENTCDFDPLAPDDHSIQNVTLAPGDTLKVKAEKIYEYVHNAKFPPEAGMYFAKFYSAAPGVMKIEKAKQAPPKGGAVIMRHGFTYPLDANSTAVFAVPTTWKIDTIHTKFTTPTEHVFRMKLASDPDFAPAHMLGEYQFSPSEQGHWYGILGTEFNALWPADAGQYLYMRFECTEATTISPEKWKVSECFKNTKNTLIEPGDKFLITRDDATIFRMDYAQWKSGDMSIAFESTVSTTCHAFISYECNISKSTSAANLLIYKQISSGGSETIAKDVVSAWETDGRVVAQGGLADGYVYVRLQCAKNGKHYITMTTNAPEETDPEYPHTTISAKCEGGKVIVEVNKAQHISVDGTSEEWDAVPGEPHTLNLNPGTYTLQGEEENIEITLP